MIEAGMFVALGFLAATLIGLMALPAIARRADRLSRRRAEAAFPLSLEQVAADRDHLRAELAVRERVMQRDAAEAQVARAAAMTDLGRREVEIGALAETLRQRDARIAELEAALAGMTTDRDRTAARLAEELAAHAAARGQLERSEADVQRLDSLLHERNEEIGVLNRRREMLEQDLAGVRSELAAANLHAEELDAALQAMTDDKERLAAALAGETATLAAAQQEKTELDRAFMMRGQELDAERRLAATHADERDAVRNELHEVGRLAAETERGKLDLERRLQRFQAEFARAEAAAVDRLRRSEDKLATALAARQAAEAKLLPLREERARLKQEAQAARRDLDRLQAAIQAENAGLRAEIMKLAGVIAGRSAVTPPSPANLEPGEPPARKAPAKPRNAAAS